MQSCPAAKLLMFAALVAAAGAHAQTPEGGPAPVSEEDPLPKLPRDATYVLDGSLERVRQSFSIPGMAIGIVENGEPVYVRAFGVRDLETGEPVTVHTLFHVASLTKTFTAAALMQLHEQQRLTLDAPIAQFVPAFANSSITVTQLMTHTAGLRDIEHPFNEDADPLGKYALKLAEHEVAYPPGQGWGYTDAAFNLLGAAIESITDTNYPRYIHQEVLSKAGMRESTFDRPDPAGDVAWPHTGKVFVSRDSHYPWDRASAPSSGLNSSINDMTRWAALHVNRDPALLSSASYDAMFQYRVDSSWKGMAMGLGWQLEKRGDGYLPRHAGQEHGFTSLITLYPQKRRAIVILSNAETTPRGEIQKVIESVLETGSYVRPQPPLLLRFNSPWLLGGFAAIVLVLVGATVISIRRKAGRGGKVSGG